MTESNQQQLQRSAMQASLLLKAMSNPNRLLILCMLVASPGIPAGELSAAIGLSPSATSQHLTRMKREGLVTDERQAQKIHYFIKDEAVKKMVATLKEIYCPEDFL